jgi:hypothetical protein
MIMKYGNYWLSYLCNSEQVPHFSTWFLVEDGLELMVDTIFMFGIDINWSTKKTKSQLWVSTWRVQIYTQKQMVWRSTDLKLLKYRAPQRRCYSLLAHIAGSKILAVTHVATLTARWYYARSTFKLILSNSEFTAVLELPFLQYIL